MIKLERNRALVVLSGGQDSVTCLGWALQRYEDVACITFDYGQRHARELDAAFQVVGFFARQTGRVIPHEVMKLPPGILAGSSPLTDHGAELERYPDKKTMDAIIGDRVELTFVPMRNALFLTLAANRAAVQGRGTLVTGVCQEDGSNYPDARLFFIQDQTDTINAALGLVVGLSRRMIIATPLMHCSKAESVLLAQRTPHTYTALALSHTAYDGSYPPVGTDHASVLRAHGFEQAGLPDPLILRAVMEGLMDAYPGTVNYSQALFYEKDVRPALEYLAR